MPNNEKKLSPSEIQWLTTRASGRAHTCAADDGVTGWRLHAVKADSSGTLEALGRQAALCGLRPRHGWSLDLFIDEPCKNCLKKTTERPNFS